MRRRRALLLAVTAVAGLGGVAGAAATSGAPSRPAPAWITYHAGNARTGVDGSSPPHASIHRSWTTPRLDGQVYGNPLIVGGRAYVATERNSVYALNAANGHVIWRRHLGAPVDGSTLPCGNINPTGITGTPAIGPGHTVLYVVAFLSGKRHVLYGIDVAHGSIAFQRRAGPAHQSPSTIQQRGALTVAHGHVYIPYGGLAGDCGQYRGAVVGVRTNGSGARLQYTVGVKREGAIWAPSGAATGGPRGELYVATGNGSSSGFDYGNSVIRLSAGLRRQSFFRPTNGGRLNDEDADLGSVGPALVSRDRMFAIGKSGVGYLLGDIHLGGVGGYQRAHQVCASAFGGTAYARPYLYVPCSNGLYGVKIERHDFEVIWRAHSNAGPPIVAGGLVWAVNRTDSTLHAYTPRTGHQVYQANLGRTISFVAPSAGGGRVLVPAGDRVIAFAGV